jgi:hypothetical protein
MSRCLLLGAKRTQDGHRSTSVFDRDRTSVTGRSKPTDK